MPPFHRLTVFEDPAPGAGSWNMAVDQALLETAPRPLLRAYRWADPHLSIGYFQKLAEIENPARLPVVRRWTGGGTVPHTDDFTFSLIVPRSHPFASLSPSDSYCAIHQAVTAALAQSGFSDLALSGSPAPTSPAQTCFTAPVRDDVMRGDQKIAGGAQRRSLHGLLHQGSIQSISPPASFLLNLASHLATTTAEKLSLTPAESARSLDLEKSRYSTASWLRRR